MEIRRDFWEVVTQEPARSRRAVKSQNFMESVWTYVYFSNSEKFLASPSKLMAYHELESSIYKHVISIQQFPGLLSHAWVSKDGPAWAGWGTQAHKPIIRKECEKIKELSVEVRLGTFLLTQGLHLEPLHQPHAFFCGGFFWDRVSQTICQG
jgi:hypothetical protein